MLCERHKQMSIYPRFGSDDRQNDDSIKVQIGELMSLLGFLTGEEVYVQWLRYSKAGISLKSPLWHGWLFKKAGSFRDLQTSNLLQGLYDLPVSFF